MICKCCHERLSRKEEAEIREMQSYCQPEVICDDCAGINYQMNQIDQVEQFSDADPGL